MLAIMERWEVGTGCHTDNTEKYLLLMIGKLGLDALVFHLCCQKLYTFFLNMCSLSIVLVDFLFVFLMATVWFLGPEKSPVSPCFLLANASATYGILPLPIMFLGLFNYCFEDANLGNQSTFCKLLRNAIWTLLVWLIAITYSLHPVKAELMESHDATSSKAVICKVDESTLITIFILVLFIAVINSMLPFWSMIPRWIKEANRLSEAREEQEKERSDLLFTWDKCKETKSSEQNYLEETSWSRPPLWISLTLGFGLFWMPYLAVSVACLLFGFEVPAYITVNVLWLECTNSLLVGLVFLVNSKMQGPYSRLPEDVCSWHVFWHLSKGTEKQKNSMAMFNPTKEKKKTLLYV
uniref:probable G-protein coupled receptor 160 n=1 Tax=Semicossyphus pulcher TaxID=241346 RepID=UPI0037E79E17